MQEKQTTNLKTMLKALMAIAGVLSIIGGIILLAMVGKYTSMSSLMYGSSSDLTSMMSSFTGIYSGQDLARFGAFALFIVSAVYASVEIFSGSSKKNMAIATAGSSVLGFVGCFLTSLSALYSSAISSATGMMSGGGIYGGDSDKLMVQLIRKMFAPWVVGGIFILVSAVLVIILVISTFIKPRPAYGYAAGNQYMQPYQQYPNQQYPNQQYPGQQYPTSQQYPNQGYTGQNPANYQPQDPNNNTPNNYQ